MRHVHFLLPVALALLLVGCGDGTSSAPEEERERLLERQSAFLSGWNERDADRTAALFAEDAMVHVAERPPLRGRSAIREFYGNVFRFMRAARATPETLRMAESGDMAYGTGSVVTSFESDEGVVEYPGTYVLVWEKRDGRWSIVVYSISNDGPASDP